MNWLLLANSLLVAGLSSVVALFIGFIVAIAITIAPKVPRNILLASTVAVLALPSFLVTNCWIDLLGVSGVFSGWLPVNIFSLPGAVWILALILWPIPALAIWSAWRKLEPVHFEIDSRLRDWHLLRYLLLPAARSHIVLAGAVVFALALNNFAVPTILQVKVFTSELWIQFNTNLNSMAALQLSWPLILAPILLLFLLRRAEVPWPRETGADIAAIARRQFGWFWSAGIIIISCGAIIFSLAAPLVQLTASSRTWSEFMPALLAGRAALVNSILYAVVAAALALALGFLLARVRRLGWMWLIFLLPGVLLGIGALTTFKNPAFDWFSRTACIVIALLTLRYLALSRSISYSALASVDTALLDSAKLEGARGLTLLRRIVLPQIAPQFAAAGYMVYLLSLWDVETILLVVPPGGETLALRIFNLLHYGHNAHVNALCMLLLLLALAPLLVFAVWRAVAGRKSAYEITVNEPAAVGVRQHSWMFFFAAVSFFLSGCSDSASDRASGAPLASQIFSGAQVIGTRGTGPGQFNKPRSLTVDAQDNLFVVDMTGRVQKFSPDGKFLLSWQMPQTDLGKPKGMCRDRDGNIIVIEPHYQRVNHFTPEGKLVTQWGTRGTNAGELTLPRAVAVDTKNNVIVSEYTVVDRVQKFSAQGRQFLANWGTPGLAPGEFNRAEGVCVDSSDRIYVADSCNHRIQVFAPDGKFLRAYGKAGEAVGDMSYPYDIQVDERGRQYVCEFGNSRIQVFDSEGRSVETIGKAGSGPGQFNNPWSITLDSKGNLYVADSQNHRVQKLLRRESHVSNAPSESRGSESPTVHSSSSLRLCVSAVLFSLLPDLMFLWCLDVGAWNFFPSVT